MEALDPDGYSLASVEQKRPCNTGFQSVEYERDRKPDEDVIRLQSFIMHSHHLSFLLHFFPGMKHQTYTIYSQKITAETRTCEKPPEMKM